MYLWIIFDVIIVGIFIICIIHSMRKGFIKASYSILSIVLTLLLMFLLQDNICSYLRESPLGEHIKQKITLTLTDDINKKTDDTVQDNSDIGLPNFFGGLIVNTQNKLETAKNELINETAENVTSSVINILSIIILYFGIRIVLFLLLRILNLIFKLPLLNSVNKLCGALIGAVNALFIIYILCAALIWLVPGDELIKTTISQTVILKYFYENNLLLKLFL